MLKIYQIRTFQKSLDDKKYKNIGEVRINYVPMDDDFIASILKKREHGGIFFYLRVDPDKFHTNKNYGKASVSSYRIYDLLEGPIQDRRIMSDLNVQYIESGLEEILHLTYLQKDGGEGQLLVNGLSNIFYLKNKLEETKVLFLTWRERVNHERFCDKKGFTFFTLPVKLVTGWEKGTRVFIPIND